MRTELEVKNLITEAMNEPPCPQPLMNRMLEYARNFDMTMQAEQQAAAPQKSAPSSGGPCL